MGYLTYFDPSTIRNWLNLSPSHDVGMIWHIVVYSITIDTVPLSDESYFLIGVRVNHLSLIYLLIYIPIMKRFQGFIFFLGCSTSETKNGIT